MSGLLILALNKFLLKYEAVTRTNKISAANCSNKWEARGHG
jgi:hypothetical protein